MRKKAIKMSLRLLLVLLLPINALLAQSPTITSFLPLAGNVGSTVTITGTNFSNVTKVWFGSAPAASFTTVNSNTVTAVVPNNAYLGNIAVATTNGFTIGTKYFMVNNPQNVVIGNNDQTSSYYIKNGKLYGSYSYDYDGGNLYRYCPVEMPSKGSLRGKTISQISNSGIHFIALASDNSVHAWGSNFKRQLGDSSATSKSRSVEITNKGDLRGKTIIQVLAGSYTSYALSSDGQVFSWGQDTLGALGNGATTNGLVWVPTSISSSGSLAGKTIIKLSKSVAANGYSNVFAIASDGTIHAWGGNGASCLGTGNSSVAEVPVNINQSGVLAGKTIVEIEGSNNSTLLIDNDGLVYAMGNGGSIGATGIQANPIVFDMLSGSSLFQKRALTVLTGKRGNYGHILDTSGVLHVIGNNVFGNLGTGNTTNANRPVLVEATTSSITGKTIVGIANGDYCTYLLASDNSMHAFGSAGNYSLMNGLTTPNATKAISINTLMPPTTDATNISISAVTQNSATISCTAGNGVGRLIVLKALNPIDTVAPVNGFNYTAAAVQPGGSTLDTSARVVYLGYGNSVNVSGLTNNRLYHVSIFEYDTFASPCRYNVFKLGTPLSGSFTTGSTLTLASLITAKPSSISTTSATLGGNITANGGATVTERGVVYNTTANPTTANTKVQIGNGIGSFSQNVTGLTASTLYHVRAYAINSVGTSYGADSTFTTLAAVPSTVISGDTSLKSIPMGITVVVDNSLAISGASTIPGANVTIVSGLLSGDIMSYTSTLPAGVTASYNALNGVLQFNGTATAAEYQTLLRSVTLKTNAVTSTSARRVSFTLGNAVPYNGHFYEFVSTPGSFTASKSAASARSYFGLQGYLVTIADSFENNYVYQKISADAWMGASDEFSEINTATGTSTFANQTAAEGNWYWVTGPEKGTKFATGNFPSTVQPGKYMNWSNFEPNNAGAGGEHYVQFFSTEVGKWNDLANNSNIGYVCEYGGMPGDPTLVLSYARNITPVLINLATVTTASATLVATTQATLGGNITADGGGSVTERGIVYGTAINPTIGNNKVSMGSGVGVFSQIVTTLTPSTLYHVRAYAMNAVGTSYGSDSTFTTPSGISLPIVTTGTVTAISNTSATLAGNVISDGGTNVTERGIVFATTINPTTANSKVTIGTGTGIFSQSVTALTAKTTYHYRAYAINSVGTTYGIDSVFTTLPNPEFNKNITNAFSPDGDGTNETWVIENADLLNGHEIIVYNIFGQVVYSQTGYSIPWDGKKDGNAVPAGEYYYQIKGDKVNIKGALLIKTIQ